MMSLRSLLLTLPALVAAREVLTFDFGWKHRAGLHKKASADARPPIDPEVDPDVDESKFDYDDGDWDEASLPHDGLIASAPSEKACPDGCSGKSFLPRHVLWYRKQFMIPDDWKRDVFWLDFEGAFRNTTVWLNGVRIANHACGYTPFRVRLEVGLWPTWGRSPVLGRGWSHGVAMLHPRSFSVTSCTGSTRQYGWLHISRWVNPTGCTATSVLCH